MTPDSKTQRDMKDYASPWFPVVPRQSMADSEGSVCPYSAEVMAIGKQLCYQYCPYRVELQ